MMSKPPPTHSSASLRMPLAWLFSVGLLLLAAACSDDEGPTSPGTPQLIIDEPVQITFDGGFDPTAAPDGTRIGYLNLDLEFVVKDVISGDSDNLGLQGFSPAWHASEDLVAFTGLRILNLHDLEINPHGSGSNREQPSWSPDGSWLATLGRSPDGVHITPYPGNETTVLPCVEPSGSGCAGEGPTVSGDGAWIAFEDGLEILKVPANGGETVEVVGGLGKDITEPAFSPDSKWIALSVQDSIIPDPDEPWIEGYHEHVWIADARGMQHGFHQLTTGAFQDRNPAWSPDSRTLYFQRDDDIWRVSFQFSSFTGRAQ